MASRRNARDAPTAGCRQPGGTLRPRPRRFRRAPTCHKPGLNRPWHGCPIGAPSAVLACWQPQSKLWISARGDSQARLGAHALARPSRKPRTGAAGRSSWPWASGCSAASAGRWTGCSPPARQRARPPRPAVRARPALPRRTPPATMLRLRTRLRLLRRRSQRRHGTGGPGTSGRPEAPRPVPPGP
jgi:hypothetical protein